MKLKIFSGLILSFCLLTALTSCTSDMLSENPSEAHGLKVGVSINSLAFSPTRASNEKLLNGTLNEDKIKTLDIYIFDQSGTTQLLYDHFVNVSLDKDLQLNTELDWRDQFKNTEQYQVYALANCPQGASDIRTVDQLKALVQTDADIYKMYGDGSEKDPDDFSKDKTFLMDGEIQNWSPKTTTGEDETIKINLKRAASKIKLFLTLSPEMKKTYTLLPNACTWKFVNYTANTSVIDSTNATKPSEQSSGTLRSMQVNADGSDSVTTYTYTNDWSKQPLENTPYILVNLPVQDKASGKTYTGNYYRIPFLPTATKKTERNFIYNSNDTICTLGSSTELTDKPFGPVNYSKIPWVVDDVDINADSVRYLLVSPTNVIMQNVDNDSSVRYYSSSDITSIKIDSVYYYDKVGDKQMINADNYGDYGISVVPSSNLRTGTITIHSNIPDNKGIRYIKFTVTNGDGKSQQVYVKQYPLEYIQFIDGWYSTRTLDTWVDWIRDQTPHSDKKITEDNNQVFFARVYDSDRIYDINDKKQYSGDYVAVKGSVLDKSTNNRCMYVIEVTSTSDQYTISHPKMDEDGISNDNVVSPAFMIASQLGVVNPLNYSNEGMLVAKHCKTYREVDTKKNKYDGWRLPTHEELDIIKKYQEGDNTVMDPVLKGKYYYAADGKTYEILSNGSNGRDHNTYYVRCVRDLSPEEVKELDEQKK
ncbi:MAG: fimbrial protein [Prevotella sp.]|nr:fimbrial protein [Prevotella sp.]